MIEVQGFTPTKKQREIINLIITIKKINFP